MDHRKEAKEKGEAVMQLLICLKQQIDLCGHQAQLPVVVYEERSIMILNP